MNNIKITTILFLAVFWLIGCDNSKQKHPQTRLEESVKIENPATPRPKTNASNNLASGLRYGSKNYTDLQNQLGKGWNTWRSDDVLSHVLLPEGLMVKIGLKSVGITGNQYTSKVLFSYKEKSNIKALAGPHAFDGSYSSLTIELEGTRLRVEAAHDSGTGLILIIKPEKLPSVYHPMLVIEKSMLWNKTGYSFVVDGRLQAQLPTNSNYQTWTSTKALTDIAPLSISSPHVFLPLGTEPIVIWTSKEPIDNFSIARASAIVAKRRQALENEQNVFGAKAETYTAIQSVLAWNMIYDPTHKRIIAPVSRDWNNLFGGQFVLFDWDTYFGALMFALGSKNMAYANAIEITKHITPNGFVPNFASSYGMSSTDRSQPPVGSFTIRALYRKYKEKWLPELVYQDLYRWNNWWLAHRMTLDSLLCWGSDPIPNPAQDPNANHWQAAAYESGLDNSPMYVGVPFNQTTHMLEQADVGLMSMYILDCNALADLAQILGKTQDEQLLRNRATAFSAKLNSLWNAKFGLYLNRRTDTKKWSYRLSPTLFYPLFTQAASGKQAKIATDAHLLNPRTFAGKWALPSIAYSDKLFKKQDYWQGRIWPPLNFMVYMGLRQSRQENARVWLAQNSEALFLKNWRESRSVYENMHAISGNRLASEPDNTGDSFYTWGGLMGYIGLVEAGLADY